MRKLYSILIVRTGIIALFIAFCGTIAAQSDSTKAVAFPAASAHKDAKLTARIIEVSNGTFGYEVLSDGKLFVRQTNVPGRPGNKGCPTHEQAEKLSALVIEKIQHGEMPPTVTTEELTTLGL